MALLSQMFRTAAITGDTRNVNAWFADRQGKRWAEQTVRAAMPGPAPQPRADTHRRLEELERTGVITAAERERLRPRLRGESTRPILGALGPPPARVTGVD